MFVLAFGWLNAVGILEVCTPTSTHPPTTTTTTTTSYTPSPPPPPPHHTATTTTTTTTTTATPPPHPQTHAQGEKQFAFLTPTQMSRLRGSKVSVWTIAGSFAGEASPQTYVFKSFLRLGVANVWIWVPRPRLDHVSVSQNEDRRRNTSIFHTLARESQFLMTKCKPQCPSHSSIQDRQPRDVGKTGCSALKREGL